MTVASSFYDWPLINPPLTKQICSPNLSLVLGELQRRYPPITNQGCMGRRTIRGGETASTHSWGAALDVGYLMADDDRIRDQVAPFLVAWSAELGLTAIHDYRRCRIWRAGRTPALEDACTGWWKAQRPSGITGMGQTWCNHLHLEVHPDAWGDRTPIAARGVE